MTFRDGHVEEHFGPFAFTLALTGVARGIDMEIKRGRLWAIPLPRFILPRTVATERAEGTRHVFDVTISLPVIGQLVRYSGWLVRDGGA